MTCIINIVIKDNIEITINKLPRDVPFSPLPNKYTTIYINNNKLYVIFQ